MTAAAILADKLHSARTRRALDLALCLLPWALVAAAWAWRMQGLVIALAVAAAVGIAVIVVAWRSARRLDHAWLARRLNATRSDMDDSADLLFVSGESLNGLQRLQQARLRERIETANGPELRPAWSARRLLLSALAAALALIAIGLWPRAQSGARDLEALSPAPQVAALPGQPRLIEQGLRIDPPAYTHLPSRSEPTLEGRVPENARLRWNLRFEPQPSAVELVFHDGQRLALARQSDGRWSAERVLAKPALYRIVASGAPEAQTRRLYRLDVTADRAPQLRMLEPDRGLSLMSAGQRGWPLEFEASDDYGLAANAQLRITLAQGSGENITFREQRLSLRGTGTTTQKRYAQRLDLASLGFASGDDLIVQLSVDDNRSPKAQTALSPSLILRWPADLGSEATGLDGMVKTTLPAYFRSQRQIIIDAEALIAQRRKLDEARFIERSDAIGVDQRLLRLRYGQFLGEESEGAPQLPTNDRDEPEPHDEPGQAHDQHAPAEKGQAASSAPEQHDEHAHTPKPAAPSFGEEGPVLEQFGHTHDHAEAATLLDPDTRKLLKAALDEMWQSELHLRQGHPQQALPYAYKALGFIKKVQQATRIYLARVGPELPPIDESRRLSGERAGLARRGERLAAANATDPLLESLWRDLEQSTRTTEPPPIDYTGLQRWLREHESRVPDPLAFAAAFDALRNEPECRRCRAELRRLLWPLLTRPPASVPRRGQGDAVDRRYFEALQQEARR
ncbi:putative transmembrane protein [Lysobacter antibioticus]|uniref:hypothetical protein n=1 Tax=Lysobacter antibioticus TaxID=84531 RepID=UPI0007170C52|nr:hypothetical protein [Lysobacter antibioticus]ALN61968.1 putative transmembrane protein [Lysobacter antibioticus]